MQILLHGFGGHGQVVQTALPADWNIVGFFENQLPINALMDIPYLGKYDSTVLPDFPLIITIGDNGLREKLAIKTAHRFASCISPHAFCAPNVQVGEGTVILQMATVQARVQIANHVIVNAGSVIDHDTMVEDFAHIGPGAVIGPNCKIGKGVFIGAGAVIPSQSIIPQGSVVPAGSVFFNQ